MILDHLNFVKIISKLNRNKLIVIYCNRKLNNICGLFILTQIFMKELYKFQIEFISTQDLYFTSDEIEYKFTSEGYCECSDLNMNTISLLYELIKSINYLKVETIWPVIICYAYHRDFLYGMKYFDNSKVMCSKCFYLKSSLDISVKTLNCKSEGIFIKSRSKLDFLRNSELSLAVNTDLTYIFSKKIFTKTQNNEMKLNGYLAKNGISIISSQTKFIYLDLQIKSLILNTFGKENKFIYKSGHDIEVTALEHGFLINYYLFLSNDIYSYLCITKRHLIDSTFLIQFHSLVISLFKQGVTNSMKSKEVIVFKIREKDVIGENGEKDIHVLAEILFPLYKIYLNHRNMNNFKTAIVFVTEGENLETLISNDLSFKSLKDKMISHNAIQVLPKELNAIIGVLSNNK